MKNIKGECFGVRIEDRKNEPLIIISSDDDGNWFDGLELVHWLKELIELLQIIEKELKEQ